MANVHIVGDSVTSYKEVGKDKSKYRTSLWADQFTNDRYDSQVAEKYSMEIEVLKDEVRSLLAAANEQNMLMNLIDTLERLGISYHFENQIDAKLENIFHQTTESDHEFHDDDLFTNAVYFRLLRQHGHRVSCDIFGKFQDENGVFLDTVKADVRGLLSLYEASHLRVHEETILDDALAFATVNLKFMERNPDLNPRLREQVVHALGQPLHFGLPRIEARFFISIYEDDEFKNETLLSFAKLDYNLLQMLYKREVCELSRWWKESDIISKLPYARNRLVECFIWALGTYFEPQYSRARVMLTKTYAFTSFLDDTYDTWGQLQELDVFTEAIQRWNLSEVDCLPEWMRPLFIAIIELYAQFDEELEECGKYAVYYGKEAVKELVRGYHTEAKWFNTPGYKLSFTEYLENGVITCTNIMHTNASLLGMNLVTHEDFEWLNTKTKIVIAGGIKGRLLNDISSYEREIKEEGKFASGIDFYMMENSVTKEETMTKYAEMIENAWKDTNEECLKPSTHPRTVLMRLVNFDRVCEFFYKNGHDGYTQPDIDAMKDNIDALLVDSIKIT